MSHISASVEFLVTIYILLSCFPFRGVRIGHCMACTSTFSSRHLIDWAWGVVARVHWRQLVLVNHLSAN